jgi:hypothetical protein
MTHITPSHAIFPSLVYGRALRRNVVSSLRSGMGARIRPPRGAAVTLAGAEVLILVFIPLLCLGLELDAAFVSALRLT